MNDYFPAGISTGVILSAMIMLIMGSCTPAELDKDSWHSLGDGVYWTQFQSEDGRECVLARKSGSGAISIDCAVVPR